MSAVSKQIFTKFRREIIDKIAIKTFAKMLVAEAYNGIVGNIIEYAYNAFGLKNAVLSYF